MDACIIWGFVVIVLFAIISLIGAWNSDDSKGIKISCTFTIVIAIGAFLCAYIRNPFVFKDGVGILGVIATIMSIPIAVLIGWNIFSALGIQKEIKDMKKSMSEEYDRVNKRMDAFEKKSDEKIDELKSERGIVKLSHSDIAIGKGKGIVYFIIESNTSWNIYVNNTGNPINGLHVYPVNGSGNATITIEYDAVETENYQQMASITIFYLSYGIRQSVTANVHRKHIHR